MWVPAEVLSGRRPEPIPDLRGVRDLPVLVVSGGDTTRTTQAVEALIADLADGVVVVEQPGDLGEVTGKVEDHTVAVLNRGLPGFNVDADGSLYLSLLRSCSGWPSGVWIDPPRRSVPDGSNFQFQHWSHTFEYALTSSAGDWRAGQTVRSGHEFNNPLIVRVPDPHQGELPATASLIRVEPSSVVLTAVKPAGNPLARMAGPDVDPANGLVLRLYESAGRATTARISCAWPIGDAAITNVAEEGHRSLTVVDGSVNVELEPFEIATVQIKPTIRPEAPTGAELGPGREAAQPRLRGLLAAQQGSGADGLPAADRAGPALAARGTRSLRRTGDRRFGADGRARCRHRFDRLPTRLAGLARGATVPTCARRPPRLRSPGRAGDRRAVGALLRLPPGSAMRPARSTRTSYGSISRRRAVMRAHLQTGRQACRRSRSQSSARSVLPISTDVPAKLPPSPGTTRQTKSWKRLSSAGI